MELSARILYVNFKKKAVDTLILQKFSEIAQKTPNGRENKYAQAP